MAKVKISDLTAAAALDGSELIEGEQDGGSVKITAQDIADFAGGGATVETTGTITGTDAVLVACFPIPDTNPYYITGSAIVKCTDAGAGTVVVGDVSVQKYMLLVVNNEAINGSYEDASNSDTSMEQTQIAPEDVDSGQLRISITPPSDTAGADSEFSYKIRLSGFSL